VSFAPEDQLLILCSRVLVGGEASARAAKLLRQDLDWEYLLETSVRHGVSPLLYHGLSQVVSTAAPPAVVPSRVMSELLALYRNTRRRNRRLYRVLGAICRACDAAGIQVLALKDIHLARDAYPDIGLRPLGDLDILIHQEDYPRMARCLQDLGFAPLPGSSLPYTLKYAWAHHFHRTADNVWVDLQWGILQREWDIYHEGTGGFDVNRMWQGATSVVFGDYTLLVPAIEDMLFHLCLHLEGHGYSELCLFCDIAEILRLYESRIKWDHFIDMTRDYKACGSVYYVLLLVTRLFAAPVPEWILRTLEPAFFTANLYEPLFGNLTRLHLILDDIRLAVAPPDGVLGAWESIVRRQAFGAMQAYRAINGLASAFVQAGGRATIFEGNSPNREFPDASLRAFEDIRWFVLDQDVHHLRHILKTAGYRPIGRPPTERYVRRWKAESSDPAIAGQPTCMALYINIEHDPAAVLRRNDTHALSKRGAAIRIAVARLRPHKQESAHIGLRLSIMALSPEALLLYLSARLGRQSRERLFGLCSLLEFFKAYPEPLNWSQMATIAAHYGSGPSACKGLLMVRDLVDPACIPQPAIDALGCAAISPHVLQQARFEPGAWGRDASFKRAFYLLFTLLSIDTAQERYRYLARTLADERRGKAAVSDALQGLGATARAGLRRERRTARDSAYWIEPGWDTDQSDEPDAPYL
jgi:Uncharacterised nucleotidyltransferase